MPVQNQNHTDPLDPRCAASGAAATQPSCGIMPGGLCPDGHLGHDVARDQVLEGSSRPEEGNASLERPPLAGPLRASAGTGHQNFPDRPQHTSLHRVRQSPSFHQGGRMAGS